MEGSEKKNKFSLAKLISISVSLVVVVAVAVFFLLNGKDSFTSDNNEENTIALSRMALSVGNEIDVDLGELNELDVEEISYSSKDENVAKINEKGVITAVNDGETDIVVVYKIEDVTYEKNVNVVVSSRSSEDFSMSDEITLKYTFSDNVKENVWTNKDVKIKVSSNANVKYAIDCEDNCKYYDLVDDNSILVSTEGEHTVTIVAYDKYGDSVVKKVNVKIDKTKPICKFVKGPNPNEIYVGETATYVIECVDENSRLKVVNDISFLDLELPKVFTFTKSSIIDVVKETYNKTKKPAIQVENIDDGYRYTLSVTGLKAGKTKLELPKSIFVDYAGNVQDKDISDSITVLDKKEGSQGGAYLNCKVSYDNGVITGSGSGTSNLKYYGFSNSYSGSNQSSMSVSKAGTYYFYVKDVNGNKKSCSVVVSQKDLVPTCSLSFDEKTNRLTGTYSDNSGAGITYYGFSSTYAGSKTTWKYIKKSGTYYFYVKDNSGHTGSCELTVELKAGKPSCSLSYNNGVLIASSFDINNVGFSYRGFSSSFSGVSEYTKKIEKPGTYYYYVKDNDGYTGSCSIDVKEIIEIKDPICSPGAFIENHTCKTCPKGYYCDGVKKEQCLKGYTSDAGTTSEKYCYVIIEPGYGADPGEALSPEKCNPGTYSPGGRAYLGTGFECKVCPIGTYSNTSGASSCTTCPDEYTNNNVGSTECNIRSSCPAGQYVDGRNCRDCPSGSYCTNGVKTVCPSPYSNSDKKSDSVSDCYIKVPAGSYIAAAEAKTTSLCSIGTYKEKHEVHFGSKSSCTACDANTTTASTGSKSKSDCNIATSCSAGQYLENGKCKTCPPDSYCINDKKTKCPSGYYDGKEGSDDITDCSMYVAAGYFVSNPTSSSRTVCQKGTYNEAHTVKYGQSSSCKKCKDGYTTEYQGAVMESQCSYPTTCSAGQYIDGKKCKDCPSGSYCVNGVKTQCPKPYSKSSKKSDSVSDCYMVVSAGSYVATNGATTTTKCPKGTYKEQHDVYSGEKSSCVPCDVNTTTAGTGAKSKSDCKIATSCPAGQYLDKDVCKACPAGKYSATAGATSCDTCAAGTYSKGGATSCTKCSAGTYQDKTGQSSCKSCPSGYTSDAGTTEQKKCYINVSAGKYIAKAKKSNQTECSKGTYSIDHIVYYESTSSCESCPSGYTTIGTGATSKDACTQRSSCGVGSYIENNTCRTCPIGYYCDGAQKVKCPDRHTSNPGAGKIESCYAHIDPGYYKKNPNETTYPSVAECPAGKYSAGGNVYYGSTLSCTNCPIGTYSLKGAASCTKCPANSTNDKEGSTECNIKTSCPAGQYLENGKCKTCPPDSYCINNIKNKCPNGYYDGKEGSDDITDCSMDVAAGYFVSYPAASSKTVCSKGTYNEAHTVKYGQSSSCKKCKTGYTTQYQGATSESKCEYPTTCPAGQYINGKKCSDCPKGSYCVNGVKTQCPKPYTKSNIKSDSIDDCYMTVSAGSYIAINGATTTTKCPKGTYKEQHDVYSGEKSSCVPCDVNTTTAGTGAKSKSDCKIATSCPAGQYLDKDVCKACPAGKYSATAGATSCDTCAAGTYSKGGATSCTKCSAGTYQDKTGQSSCIKCPAGQYSASSGLSSCKKCSVGTYSSEGWARCETCPNGYTTSAEGSSKCDKRNSCSAGQYLENGACLNCPAGYTSDAGATSKSKCYKNVPAGHYISNADPSALAECSWGTYSSAHKGYYGAKHSCTKCPDGYTIQKMGGVSISECKIYIDAGTYLETANSSNLSSCPEGTYSSGNVYVYYGKTNSCTTCPKGYTSSKGAKSQKECYIVVPAGKYIATANSSTLSSCAAGTFKTQHTVKYGNTSTCDKCDTGTYSTAGAGSCSNCPTGYTAGAGAASKFECKIYVSSGKYIKNAYSTTPSSCTGGSTSSSHYVEYGKTSSCSACPDGTYGVNGKCETCSDDHYCTGGTQYKCPDNYPYTTKEGASKKSDCYARVDHGYYIPSAGANQKKCESGSYTTSYKIVHYGDTNKCESCPEGYKNSVVGATSKSECYMNVPAGKYVTTKNTTQTASCAKGTYSEAHKVYYSSGKVDSCTKCDSGTTTSGTGSTSKSACSLSTCVRDQSCGCEAWDNKWVYISTEDKYQSCSKDPSNGSKYRCTAYSTSNSSSGSKCRWECKKYEYKSTCTQYKCCEINKGDDFEFNLINYDFINEMISKTLSGLF